MKYLLLLLISSCSFSWEPDSPKVYDRTILSSGEECYRGHVYFIQLHYALPAFNSEGKPLKCEDVK